MLILLEMTEFLWGMHSTKMTLNPTLRSMSLQNNARWDVLSFVNK